MTAAFAPNEKIVALSAVDGMVNPSRQAASRAFGLDFRLPYILNDNVVLVALVL